MNCPNCGYLTNGENFCPFCGAPLSGKRKRGGGRRFPGGGNKLRPILGIAAAVLVVVVVGALLMGILGGDDDPAGVNNGGGNASNNAGGGISSLFNGSGNSQPAGPVANAITPSQYNKAPANGVQDIRFWMRGQFCRNGVTDMGEYKIYEYGSGALDGDVVESYVAMLQQNGFTLVEKFYESYYTNSYLSYGLMCDFLPGATTHEQLFTSNQVHVSIYKSRDTDWSFYISEDLEYCDLGIRENGGNVEIIPRGDSAGAGLDRLSDGSYQTSDGRLNTQVGSAVVIREGVQNTANAFLELENGRCILTINGYMPDEELVLDYEEGSLDSGDIFLINDLTDGEPALSMTIDGERVGLNRKFGSEFHSITVRVMHYEESKDAVLYIYVETHGGSPAMMEVLCAFSTMPYVEPPETRPTKVDATYSTIEGETYSMGKGDSILLDIGLETYHFGSDYFTYDWEVVSGGDVVDIYGVGNNCYITGTASGTAVVTLRFGYTEEGNNVLTGNPQTEHHTKELTFTIHVK